MFLSAQKGPPAPGSHCLHHCASSRMPYKWAKIVCSICIWLLLLGMVLSRFCRVLPCVLIPLAVTAFEGGGRASWSWKGKETDFPQSGLKGTQPRALPDFSPMPPILDFWPTEVRKFVLLKPLNLWWIIIATIQANTESCALCALRDLRNTKNSSYFFKVVF